MDKPSSGGSTKLLAPQVAAGSATLVEARDGAVYRVLGIAAPAQSDHWSERLAEIGFIAGEQVRILSRAQPGGDPLAVRIGCSTFALRRAEAACIQVEPLTRPDGVGAAT